MTPSRIDSLESRVASLEAWCKAAQAGPFDQTWEFTGEAAKFVSELLCEPRTAIGAHLATCKKCRDAFIPGGAWLLHFEDADVASEVFSGAGAKEAAEFRFEEASQNWNCTLFAQVSPDIDGRAAEPSQPIGTVETGSEGPLKTGIVTDVYYSCNGSPTGCQRERFGQCEYHDDLDLKQLGVLTEPSPAKPREPRRIWVKPLEEGNIFGNRFVFSREPAEEAVEFVEVLPGQEDDEQAAFRIMRGWDAELAERTKERDEARAQLRKVQIELYGDADDDEELPPFDEMISDIKAAVDAVGQCGNLEQQLAAKGKRLDVTVGLVQQRQGELAQLRERLAGAEAALRRIRDHDIAAEFAERERRGDFNGGEVWCRIAGLFRCIARDALAAEPNLLDQAGGDAT